MSCTVELLTAAGRGVEAQIRPALEGLFGGVVRSYLPQRWVFTTEEGSATLGVEPSGEVWVRAGTEPAADVVVTATHSSLAAVLKNGTKASIPKGSIRVTPRTTKGRTAFDFARKRLGV